MIKKLNSHNLFISLYVFAVLVFITHFIMVGKGVYGDARYYYSYLPSIIIDHNLEFKNAFKYFGIEYFKTPLGNPANIYPIGPAIVWFVPFISVHLLLSLFNLNDGYNNVYQFVIGIWNITLVFIGLYFLKKSLTKLFSEKIAYFTVFTVFLTTNLLFYGVVDVINSHSASFFASSLFLYFWLNKKIKLSGLMLGLLVLIRPQDALFAILPISAVILSKALYQKSVQDKAKDLKYNILDFLTAAFISIIVFSPQFLIWKILWATWYINPYLKVETFNFKSPQVVGLLFNSGNGLLLWTPIIILCLIGLIQFAKKNRYLGIPFILLVLGQIYVVSSWSVWWQGASFSGRMFISSLPVLSFGLAFIYNQKILAKYKIFISSFLSILNILLIILFLSKN